LSAKKRIRQNAKHRARNRARKDLIKMEVRGFTAALASGDVAKATAALSEAASRIDKVAAKGSLHKNAAARKRSQLAKKLNVMRANGGKAVETEKKGAGRGAKKPGATKRAAKA
jgi:small subunit ribosomal protein S20